MPTRNSRAGLLSRLPLRGLSQVKLVSHPRGATATLSRSSFAFTGAGGGAVWGPDERYSHQPNGTQHSQQSPSRTAPLHGDLLFLRRQPYVTNGVSLLQTTQ